MSEFVIKPTDLDAKSFRVYRDGDFIYETRRGPGEIAQDLLERSYAKASDRFILLHFSGRNRFDFTVAGVACYSDKKTLQSLKHFSAHLPPEPINAGGGNSSLPSSATLSTNDLRGSTKS